MHWFAYAVIGFVVFLILMTCYFWRSYQVYRTAWRKKHVDEMMGALWGLRAEQLTEFDRMQNSSSAAALEKMPIGNASLDTSTHSSMAPSMPSSFTTSAGVRLGYAIYFVGNDNDRRVRHHLTAEAGSFFGQVLAERALAFSLQRLGFAPEQVELCITAYTFDSFHATVELTMEEHHQWSKITLAPLPSDPSPLAAAHQYREQLGRPRVLVKTQLPPRD